MFIVQCSLFNCHFRKIDFFGDRTERATPVPIPNTEVKPLRADGTARATAWETRSSPGIKTPKGRKARRGFCFYAKAKRSNKTATPIVIHNEALRCWPIL